MELLLVILKGYVAIVAIAFILAMAPAVLSDLLAWFTRKL